MKFSADRILTTHTGSLPRPPDLVALLNSKELGESYDRAAFSHRVGRAILEIMRRQADAGIDIVDDGEHSKVNWMAYARARLSGLEEIDSPVRFRGPTRDSLAFPRAYEDMKVMLAARSADIVPKRMVRPRAQVCAGAISYVGQDELAADIENLKVALESVSVEEAFMTAISPSNLELYYENRYYASDQQYLVALADAMHISAAALGDGDALAQADARKTFVLIHGAYHGGWCWRKVVDILERRGHKVYAPSLTGLADRSHLLSMSLTLDTHITDISNLFRWEEIRNACLVPHSYGGWPASGALEQIGDRVTSIVWLDAFMPKDGERSTDMISEFSRRALAEAMAKGEPGRKPPKASQYSISEKDYEWMDSKLTAQPNSITDNPIKLTGALQKVPKKTFIRAPKYPQAAFDRAFAECRADPSWTTYVVESSHHDVMIDQPEWLADILMKHS